MENTMLYIVIGLAVFAAVVAMEKLLARHNEMRTIDPSVRCVREELGIAILRKRPIITRYMNIPGWLAYVKMATTWRPGYIRYVCPRADSETDPCDCSAIGMRVPALLSAPYTIRGKPHLSRRKKLALRFHRGESEARSQRYLQFWGIEDWSGYVRPAPVEDGSTREEE